MSDDTALEAKAAKILVAALIDSLERVAPGTIDHIDNYMVEALSRPAIERDDREAITVARSLLAGLRGR